MYAYMFKKISLLLLSFILLSILIPFKFAESEGTPLFIVSVSVKDVNGNPVSGTKIIFYNWLNPAEHPIVVDTDDKGVFEGAIKKGAYLVYIVHLDKNGVIDYVPEKIELYRLCRESDKIEINATLYPSAQLKVEGDIMFVGGIWQGSLLIEVYDVNGNKISRILQGGAFSVEIEGERKTSFVSLIDTYGITIDRILIEKILNISIGGRKAFVPANIPLRIKVSYRVFDKRTNTIRTYSLYAGRVEEPLILSPGEISNIIDLTKVSIESSLSVVKQDISYSSQLLYEFESLGFYLPDELESLRKAERLMDEAIDLYASNGSYKFVIANLEKAYVITRDAIPRRLFFVKTVAMEGAIILPVFLAVFATVLAYYIFEEDKRKVFSFLIFYAVLLAMFMYIYPGFPILWRLNRTLFLIAVSSSFIFFAVLLFVVPRVIKEPELPGEIDVPGLISISFSLAKRYSKVRKLRTFITVFSIAVLIWAFTVLASFSQVYAKIYEGEIATYPHDLILVRRVVNGSQRPLNFELDTDILKSYNVSNIAYRVYNDPRVSLSIRIRFQDREYVIHGVVGLSPNEKDYTEITKFFNGNIEKFGEYGYITLPSKAYMQLGVKEEDDIVVSFECPGFEIQKMDLKVAGMFLENNYDQAQDPDGFPLKPFKMVKNKVVYVNSTDFVILNWKQILYEVFSGQKTSGIFYVYSIVAKPSSPKSALKTGNELMDRRGGEYVVVLCSEGKCSRIRYGAKMESVLEKDISFIVPLVIVVINVLITMYDIVRERKKEIFIFTTVGFNPLHIALVFMAEAVIYGLLSGGFGYVSGLATFRILGKIAYAQNLMIREKLEWYWSFVAILIAIFVAILGAFKPAMEAAFMYSPTEKRKIKLEEKEIIKREDMYLVTTAKKTIGIPGSVDESDAEIFFAYLSDKLKEYSIGEIERIEDIREEEEEIRPDGSRIKRIAYTYITRTAEDEKVIIKCELRIIKDPEAKKYRVELVTEPVGETSIRYMDFAADLVRSIMRDWERERERLF